MFKAVADGRIKALWIMATNPVVSMPDADAVEAAIKACPFVVVSDVLRDTDTTRHADVLLPSLGWGEKNGTVTNSERRISRQRDFLEAPGQARADWWQLAEVARRMGFAKAFTYGSSSQIFREHAALSAFENGGSRDFDIGAHMGLDNAAYEALAPFQWPQAAGRARSDKRFFADGGFYHADGRARFIAIQPTVCDRTNADYPFTLNTGRIRDQWHTMTRTGKSARLSSHIAEPFAELHPRDALEIGVGNAALVEIESPHGKSIARALITERQARGSVFVPMHWNDQFAAKSRIDAVVAPVTDPVSGEGPSLPPRMSPFPCARSSLHFTASPYPLPSQRRWVRPIGHWRKPMAAGGRNLHLMRSKKIGIAGAGRHSPSRITLSHWVMLIVNPATCGWHSLTAIA